MRSVEIYAPRIVGGDDADDDGGGGASTGLEESPRQAARIASAANVGLAWRARKFVAMASSNPERCCSRF
jgi:hypothetical protein